MNMKIYCVCVIVTIAIVQKIDGNVILDIFGNIDKTTILSGECRSTIGKYIDNIKNSTDDDMWALTMWDATSKLPVGLISYNFGELGNFEQCLKVKSISDNIIGKYCLGSIIVTESSLNDTAYHQINWKKLISVVATGINETQYPTWAICIPSNCTDIDALNILRSIQVSGIEFKSVTCQTTDDVNPKLTTWAIGGISFLSILASIMFLSTCYDLYCRSKGADPAYLALIAFSVYTNSEKLFLMKKSHNELSFLSGMRFISLMWVMVLHTRSSYNYGPIFNRKQVIELTNSFALTMFLSGGCAASTFLVIGGVLVSYVFFKQKRNEQEFHVLKYYLHRYIRLTPALAGVVLFRAAIVRYMSSGPDWGTIEGGFERPCQKYWFSTLLYIQNYVNANQMCILESWYLDVDMQMFLISPLILLLLNKRPKTAIALLVLACLVTFSAGVWVAYDDHLFVNSFDIKSSYYSDFYFQTHFRASSWLMGVIVGYLLTRDTAISLRIPKILSALAWVFSFVVMTICVFGGHTLMSSPDHDRIGNAFFVSFQNSAWSVCIGWIIWACGTNRGGIISTILSYPIFQFLNQFGYSIYLLHMMIIGIKVYSQKIAFYYSLVNLVHSFCGIFVFTFGLSIIWVLAFESPVVVLEKILWRNKK